MSRRISHGAKRTRYNVVICDHQHGKHTDHTRYPGEPKTCGEEFRSWASSDAVLTAQLDALKWSTRPDPTVKGVIEDFCPYHTDAMMRRMSASGR